MDAVIRVVVAAMVGANQWLILLMPEEMQPKMKSSKLRSARNVGRKVKSSSWHATGLERGTISAGSALATRRLLLTS
jgi:hypothetical protein